MQVHILFLVIYSGCCALNSESTGPGSRPYRLIVLCCSTNLFIAVQSLAPIRFGNTNQQPAEILELK